MKEERQQGKIKREQIVTYNAWRGIAAIMILLSHMAYLENAENPVWHGLWSHFMHNGGIASSFFFLTSGYFICYSWKNLKFVSYMKDKIKRVYPLTFIVFMLAMAVDILLAGNNVVSEGVDIFSLQWFFNAFANIFLLKAFIPLRSTFYSFHGPSWYISVLFGLYIVAYYPVKGIKSDVPATRAKWLKILRGGGINCLYDRAVDLHSCEDERVSFPVFVLCESLLSHFGRRSSRNFIV